MGRLKKCRARDHQGEDGNERSLRRREKKKETKLHLCFHLTQAIAAANRTSVGVAGSH